MKAYGLSLGLVYGLNSWDGDQSSPGGSGLLGGPDKAEQWEDQRQSYSLNHKWLFEEQKQVCNDSKPSCLSENEKTSLLLWVSRGTAEKVAQQWTLLKEVKSPAPCSTLLTGRPTGRSGGELVSFFIAYG